MDCGDFYEAGYAWLVDSDAIDSIRPMTKYEILQESASCWFHVETGAAAAGEGLCQLPWQKKFTSIHGNDIQGCHAMFEEEKRRARYPVYKCAISYKHRLDRGGDVPVLTDTQLGYLKKLLHLVKRDNQHIGNHKATYALWLDDVYTFRVRDKTRSSRWVSHGLKPYMSSTVLALNHPVYACGGGKLGFWLCAEQWLGQSSGTRFYRIMGGQAHHTEYKLSKRSDPLGTLALLVKLARQHGRLRLNDPHGAVEDFLRRHTRENVPMDKGIQREFLRFLGKEI